MARTPKAAQMLGEVQNYIDGVAKNLIDRIYGPQGLPWGAKLAELEDVVVTVREALSERMLTQALARQATAEERPKVFRECPGCGGEGQPRDPEPRNLQTRAGEARWHEPHEYCRKCRQAFFPSVQVSRD